LFVLNEDSDTITTHAIAADGTLQATGSRLACGSPVCLVFGKG
jgi:6-phosphogluconolactonase (cycloisomerase 2 family)